MGLDARALDLYAGGTSVRDIAAHLSDLYGVEVGADTISRVSDAVLEDVQAWRTRTLERVYRIVYFDALMLKVREDRSVRPRAGYLAMGVSDAGDRETPGTGGRRPRARSSGSPCSTTRTAAALRMCCCCVDGLTGFPEAIEAVFPQARVQTCIVASDPRLDALLRQRPRPQNRRRPRPDDRQS